MNPSSPPPALLARFRPLGAHKALEPHLHAVIRLRVIFSACTASLPSHRWCIRRYWALVESRPTCETQRFHQDQRLAVMWSPARAVTSCWPHLDRGAKSRAFLVSKALEVDLRIHAREYRPQNGFRSHLLQENEHTAGRRTSCCPSIEPTNLR